MCSKAQMNGKEPNYFRSSRWTSEIRFLISNQLIRYWNKTTWELCQLRPYGTEASHTRDSRMTRERPHCTRTLHENTNLYNQKLNSHKEKKGIQSFNPKGTAELIVD